MSLHWHQRPKQEYLQARPSNRSNAASEILHPPIWRFAVPPRRLFGLSQKNPSSPVRIGDMPADCLSRSRRTMDIHESTALLYCPKEAFENRQALGFLRSPDRNRIAGLRG